MTKLPRIHFAGAVYYITSRGDNNENIFKDAADYRFYLELLKKYKQQYGFKLFSYCLLPNHLHMLIELKEGITISDIMHDLNSNYTKYFNGRYQRKGHLFQERYKMNLLEKAVYLLSMTAYIHLNPKVLGLAGNLEDYEYSSFKTYLGAIRGFDLAEEIKEVNNLLNGSNSGSHKEYIKNISKQEMDNLAEGLNKKTIMGSEEFMQKIKSEVSNYEAQLNEPIKYKPVSRRFIVIGSLGIVVLGILSYSLFVKVTGLKQEYKIQLERKNTEVTNRIKEEKKKVYKDLEEKYQADRVSYEAMARRLEIEKKKARESGDKTNKR